jgi:hypothetical protein
MVIAVKEEHPRVAQVSIQERRGRVQGGEEDHIELVL